MTLDLANRSRCKTKTKTKDNRRHTSCTTVVCACCDDLAEPAPGVSDEVQQWILSLDHTLEDDPTLPVSTHGGHRVHNVRRSHLARCVPPSQCADGCVWLFCNASIPLHGALASPAAMGTAERVTAASDGQIRDLV